MITREQAIKKFRKDIDNQQKWSIFAEDVESLLHTIYDDFESRICLNCKYHKYIEKSFRKCDVLEINTSNDFGCNLWESKE